MDRAGQVTRYEWRGPREVSDVRHDDLLRQIAVLKADLAGCRQENEELQQYLGQRMDADQAAVQAWQARTKSDFAWPKHTDLVMFLMERLNEGGLPPDLGPVERLTRDLKTAAIT